MKEVLKKMDLVGLTIIMGAVVVYSVQSTWSVYQTVALVLGAVIVLVSIVSKLDEIRAGLARK